jgi:hypothetical protein
MTSPAVPEWDELGIPVDDEAEPDDADVPHSHDDAAAAEAEDAGAEQVQA